MARLKKYVHELEEAIDSATDALLAANPAKAFQILEPYAGEPDENPPEDDTPRDTSPEPAPSRAVGDERPATAPGPGAAAAAAPGDGKGQPGVGENRERGREDREPRRRTPRRRRSPLLDVKVPPFRGR